MAKGSRGSGPTAGETLSAHDSARLADEVAGDLDELRERSSDRELFSKLKRKLARSGAHALWAEACEIYASSLDSFKAAELFADAAASREAAGQPNEAEDDLRRALDSDPANAAAASRLAERLVEARRYAEAAAVVEGEIETLGQRQVEQGDKAKDALTRRRAQRHAMLAQIWDQHLGRVERALHHWQRAWKLDPTNTSALASARDIYASLGDDEMVARLYRAELDAMPASTPKHKRAALQLRFGQVLIRGGLTAEATEALEEAARLAPDQPAPREALAGLYASPEFAADSDRRNRAGTLFAGLGDGHLRSESYDDAIRYFRRALGVDPFLKDAVRGLETALLRCGRWKELDKLYRQRQAIAEDSATVLTLLKKRAELYRDHLADQEALQECLESLAERVPPFHPYTDELRGLYRETQQWEPLAELMRNELTSLAEDDPRLDLELLELATIEREFLGNRDQAADCVHQILQRNPLHDEALARYTEHFRERRDWRGLADLTEFSADMAQQSGAAPVDVVRRLEELAELAELRLGDLKRAISTWQRIAELGAGSPQIKAKSQEALRRLSSKAKVFQSLVGVLEQEAASARTPEERAEALRRIAQGYRERQINPRRAIALYEEILGLFPADRASLSALLELYDREGDDAGAAHTLRRQLDLDVEEHDRNTGHSGAHGRDWPVAKRVERLNSLRRLAAMYEDQLADVDGVVFACSGILEILPGDRDALARMERVLEKAGDVARLEQTLTYHAESASGPAERARVLRKLAALASDRNDDLTAMERWENVLSTVKNDTEALDALSELYNRHHRWAELATVLERGLMSRGDVEAGSGEAAEHAAELRRYGDVVANQLGDAERAVRAYNRVLELLPKDRGALEALAELYETLAAHRELSTILERQVELYLGDEPERAAEVTLQRARIYESRLGAPAEAIAALQFLIEDIDPANLGAHKALRRLYEARGDFEPAVRVAEREMYLAQDDSQRIARGMEIGFLCRDRLDDPTRALMAFERVLELDPIHDEALAAAADLYAQVGRWERHVELLRGKLERTENARDERALLLRIAQITAEKIGDPKAAFQWYRDAHRRAADESTLAELRRAAETYGLWEELSEIYQEARDAAIDDHGNVTMRELYLDACRELASIAERRQGNPRRAMECIKDALTVDPTNENLLSEAERIAGDANNKIIWQHLVDCLALPVERLARSGKVAVLVRRARILEDKLGDTEGAMTELLRAFSWSPSRQEVRQAIFELADRADQWEAAISIESALIEYADSRDTRLAAIGRKAKLIEEEADDRVRAFRTHLSGFLLAPEDQETLAHLWRLGRDIALYEDADRVPKDEPPAAHIERPESKPRRLPRATQTPPGSTAQRSVLRQDATVQLKITDLFFEAADETNPLYGDADETNPVPQVDDPTIDTSENFDLSENTVDESGEQEIPPPSREDSTMPIDLGDLMGSGGQRRDPTMELRTEDLIQAIGGRKAPAPPPLPGVGRTKNSTGAPPLPPPARPRIKRETRLPPRAATPTAVPQQAPRPVKLPTMPKRPYVSPWDELAAAYELLPTPSTAIKLRWLFRSAEVQENGAGDVARAFDILATALEIAPDRQEPRDRLYSLAEQHGQWDRLAALFEQISDNASSSQDSARYLMEVADIRVRQGRPLETESLYRRVLGMRPDDETARKKLEELYRSESRYIDLAASLEERTDPRLGVAVPESERPAMLRELVDIYSNQLSRSHDAVDALNRLKVLTPDDAWVHQEIARHSESMGRWSQVIEALQRLADVTDDDTQSKDSLLRVGDIYERELELPDRAVDAFRQVAERWPEEQSAYQALDRLYQGLARWDDLSAILRRRAALARDSEERANLLHRRAGVLLEWLDSPDEAAAALRHARTIVPESDELTDALITALIRADRQREAVAVLEGRVESLRDNNSSPGVLAAVLVRLATLRHDVLEDPELAEAALAEALELVPGHPTAIATKARLAKTSEDPEAYARALLAEAEVHSDVDRKVEILLEAGHVLASDLGDVDGARSAFESILALRPYDAEATWALAGLIEEGGDLESAAELLGERLKNEELSALERAELHTQLAALSRRGGVDAAAEHHAVQALAAVPTHQPAIFARADLLAGGQRWAELESFLSGLLPVLDEEADAPVRAEVRRRLAAVADERGSRDEAYQMLLDADRLHRGDLPIKLALGENRYRARRWREAALHLSALATHDDAERYPAEVAEGLYHAALAEIRSLRPDKAQGLYERALQLKPNFRPALHALAEIAMEQGDTKQAADLLTRQANATTEPDERLRMFEALGDMAAMTLGDDERARVCYEAAVGAADPLDATHIALLKKLLAKQESAEHSMGMARTAELLASFATTAAERARHLAAAARAYLDGGDDERARATADRALEAAPGDLPSARVAAQLAHRVGESQRATELLGKALTQAGEPENAAAQQDHAEVWALLGAARADLGESKGAITALQRAIELAPKSSGALSARKTLVEMAESGRKLDVDGDVMLAHYRFLARKSGTRDDLVAYARALCRGNKYDGGRALLELARALGHELSEDDWVFLRKNPVRVMAADEAYNGALPEPLIRSLLHDANDAAFIGITETLWEAAALLWKDVEGALAAQGVAAAERLSTSVPLPAKSMYTRAANAVKSPATLLYGTEEPGAADVSAVCVSPPIIAFGPRLMKRGSEGLEDGKLRFLIGQAAAMARPEFVIPCGMPEQGFVDLLATVYRVFSTDDVGALSTEDREFRTTLPVRLRSRLKDSVSNLGLASEDEMRQLAADYRASAFEMAARAGYLLSGDAESAAKEHADHGALVDLALSDAFLEGRATLGVGVLK